MKNFLKIVYIVGVLFWGSFLVYAIGKLVVFNGIGTYYNYSCQDADDLQIIDMTGYYKICYSYSAGSDVYKKTEEVSREFFREQIGEVPAKLTVCYNATYPKLSYIKNVNLATVQAKTGIVISSFFLAFISIVYLFAKRDYWIQKYKTFFGKLSASNDSA